MKEISLTKGKVAIVDDDDYERLMNNKWYFHNGGYAARRKNKKIELMHRVILNPNGDSQVDHINGNRLDNRKENLRIVTILENNINRGIQSTNTSGYKGVSWNVYKQKWHAYISKYRIRYFIGYFDSKHEAAQAYNQRAVELYGEYAKLNEIKEGESIATTTQSENIA